MRIVIYQHNAYLHWRRIASLGTTVNMVGIAPFVSGVSNTTFIKASMNIRTFENKIELNYLEI